MLHGPNLNLLGTREPAIYGTATLADVDARLRSVADSVGADVEAAQTNHEGVLVVVLNAGGYTHTSVALLDAVRACGLPVVECHISNTAAREPFRRRSRIAPACVGTVAGFGAESYVLALRGLVAHLEASGRRTG